MTLGALVTGSVILAGISVALQTIAFIIPGWLILESKEFSVNMALWYVTYCEHVLVNLTDPTTKCDHHSYNGFLNERNAASVLNLRKYFSNVASTQLRFRSLGSQTSSYTVLEKPRVLHRHYI